MSGFSAKFLVVKYGYFCDYFSLKALDLVTMKALDSKVNIIPVIAKSDTITKQELTRFKAQVLIEWAKKLSKILNLASKVVLSTFYANNKYSSNILVREVLPLTLNQNILF